MKKLLIIFAISVFSITAFSQTKYNSYGNARFNYTIAYPTNLIPQGESDNGDGQIFKNDDATLTVFGSNMLANEKMLKEYNAVIKERGAQNVTYKTFRKISFVVSGKADGKIFYQKTIRQPDNSFITFIFEYNEAKRDIYDKVTTKIAQSFKE